MYMVTSSGSVVICGSQLLRDQQAPSLRLQDSLGVGPSSEILRAQDMAPFAVCAPNIDTK